MHKHAGLALALAAALAASGCATLVPPTPQAQAGIPAEWPLPEVTPTGADAGAETPALPMADIGWRDFFADPRLEEVVALALDNNRDLRVAILNVERARAQYRIQRAESFPSVGVSGEGSSQRLPADVSPSGQSGISRQYTAGIGTSAYELDLFGRVRSLNDDALQRYFATEESRKAAQLSLVAEV